MNWVQFKGPVSHMCLAGAVVRWLGGRGSNPYTVMTNILSLNSLDSVKTFRKISTVPLEKCSLAVNGSRWSGTNSGGGYIPAGGILGMSGY